MFRKLLLAIFLIVVMMGGSVVFADESRCPKRLYEYENKDNPLNLFFIEKNNNANVFFYDANLDSNGLLNKKEPIIGYWILYEDGGKRTPASFIERKLAFGIKNVREIVAGREYSARIASMDRDIVVKLDDNGCVQADTYLDRVPSRIEKIMLELTGPTYFSTLEYMEMFGQVLANNNPIFERWFYEMKPEDFDSYQQAKKINTARK